MALHQPSSAAAPRGSSMLPLPPPSFFSLAQTLLDFDLDICAVGFDGSRVVVLPRALAALDSGFSRLRPYLRETLNTRRPVKYAARGYGLALPDWCGTAAAAADRMLPDEWCMCCAVVVCNDQRFA